MNPSPEAPAAAVGLAEALGAGRGDLVSLVGGGGKTTSMYRLVAELRAAGVRAAAATTTKIRPPGADEACRLVLAETWEELVARLGGGAEPVVLGRALASPQKVAGISPEWCGRLLADGHVETLVVEADGAARKPLKAPAPWEPVVPEATTLFVAVAGLSGLGAPLGEAQVFRHELAGRVAGLAPGEAVTAAALARLLVAPEGLAKGRPPGARAAAVLNQADRPGCMEPARAVARAVAGAGYERVLIAALGREQTVREVWR